MSSTISNMTARWNGMDRRRRRLALIAAAVALGLVLAVVFALRGGRDRAVRGDDPIALATFIRTAEFDALPSEQKVPYLHSVRKQMSQIESARREGRIDGKAYRDAYICTWMARKLDDMQDYYKLPPAKRSAWLDREVADDGPPGKSAPAPASADVSPDGGLLYDDAEERKKFDEAKDEFEEEFLERWTPDARRKWEEFRKVYKARRDRARPAGRSPGAATRASPVAGTAP